MCEVVSKEQITSVLRKIKDESARMGGIAAEFLKKGEKAVAGWQRRIFNTFVECCETGWGLKGGMYCVHIHK